MAKKDFAQNEQGRPRNDTSPNDPIRDDNRDGQEKSENSRMDSTDHQESIEKIFDNRNVTIIVKKPDPYDTFSEEELAEKLGVEVKTVRNQVLRARRLAHVPFGKGERRILRKDWEDFLDRKRVPSVDEFSSMAKKARTP